MDSSTCRLPLFALIACALIAGGCSRGARVRVEDNRAAKGDDTKADDWTWADASGPSGPTGPTGALTPARTEIETPAPRTIPTTERRPPQRAETKRPPTDRLERDDDRVAGRDDDRVADRDDDVREGSTRPSQPRVLTAPAGASATVRLDTALDSGTSTVGQDVSATLAADLTDGAGHVVLPAGTRLSGRVTEADAARKVEKKSAVAFQLTSARLPDGRTVAISTGKRLEGRGWTKKDGAIIGGSAAGGAILGQVLGGDTQSTAAGAILGGAIGSGVAMSKKGEDVAVPAGTEMVLTLEAPVTVES